MTQVHDRFSAKPVLSTRKVSSDTGVNLGITLLVCVTEEPKCVPGANFGLISIVTAGSVSTSETEAARTAPRGKHFGSLARRQGGELSHAERGETLTQDQ